MKRLAHRGYSDLFPENTMSAFEKAAHSSFEGIETDVQMTKDGILVLLHDDNNDLRNYPKRLFYID